MRRILLFIAFIFWILSFIYQLSATDKEESLKGRLLSLNDYSLPAKNLMALPDDALFHTFSYLDVKSFLSLSMANQAWKAITDDIHSWQDKARKFLPPELLEKQESLKFYKNLIKECSTYSFQELTTPKEMKTLQNPVISPDGLSVIGWVRENSVSNSTTSFFLSKENVSDINATFDKAESIYVKDISLNGQIVIGWLNEISTRQSHKAFAWNQKKGIQLLGTLNEGNSSSASAISKNGLTIVGSANDGACRNARRAFTWTLEKGIQSLGTLNRGNSSSASAVHKDGLTIIGTANDGLCSNEPRAFVWTLEKGMQSLGTLNGGNSSSALAISDDEMVVGGAADGLANENVKAFYWEKSKGMKALGPLARGTSCANDISGDSFRIVGWMNSSSTDNSRTAFVWSEKTGMQSIEKLLEEKNLLPRGWRLREATSISANGIFIVGRGEFKGKARSWRVTIPRQFI